MKRRLNKLKPGPSNQVLQGFNSHTDEQMNGKRYGLIIKKPAIPAAACDEVALSCTAYGSRIEVVNASVEEPRTILSSCELDDPKR